MKCNASKRFWLILPLAALLAQGCLAQAGKEKPSPSDGESTKLRVEVTAGEKSEPVESASVYVKFQKERLLAKDKMIEMNVKTNREGVAKIPTVPRGKVLVQVIAPGWKTYGKWYDVTEQEQTIKINLQKPPRWY